MALDGEEEEEEDEEREEAEGESVCECVRERERGDEVYNWADLPPTEIIPPGEWRQREQRERKAEIGRENRTTERKRLWQKRAREKREGKDDRVRKPKWEVKRVAER